MIKSFCLFYYLIAQVSSEESDSNGPATIYEDEELDICPLENFNLPVSFSYDVGRMKNIKLYVDESGLEKLDFCKELSDSLKEQLVIYTIFFEKVIWLGYICSSRLESYMKHIMENLGKNDQNCEFAKNYEISIEQGTYKILREKLRYSYKIDDCYEMSSVLRKGNKVHVAQKDLSDLKYKEMLEKVVSEYYEKRKYKKNFNTNSRYVLDIRGQIRNFFRLQISVNPLGRRKCISKKALDNLVDFFIITLQHSIDRLPGYVFESPEGLPLFLVRKTTDKT